MTEPTVNPVLCIQTRNGITENMFRGVVCVARVKETYEVEIIHSRGNIDQMIYPRSANKYVQILPLLESGAADHFKFTDKEIAVMCASHNAEPDHLTTVREILAKIDCKESDLQCGSHTPVDLKSAFQYCLDAGTNLYPFQSPIFNNCSGKHAGMLALCKFLGHPIEGYLSPDHPIQLLMKEAACDIFDIQDGTVGTLHIGVDGCCVPAFAMPVRNAAIGYSRMSKPHFHPNPKRSAAISRMIASVTSYPQMVHGTTQGSFDSILMSHYKDILFCKRGAAGCHLIGLRELGLGCCVKIEAGVDEPKFNVIVAFLRWCGIFKKQSIECTESTDNANANANTNTNTNDNASDNEDGIPQVLQRFYKTPNVNCKGDVVGHTSVLPSVFGDSNYTPSI